MKTFFYKNYADGKIIFQCDAESILDADAKLLLATNIVAQKDRFS